MCLPSLSSLVNYPISIYLIWHCHQPTLRWQSQADQGWVTLREVALLAGCLQVVTVGLKWQWHIKGLGGRRKQKWMWLRWWHKLIGVHLFILIITNTVPEDNLVHSAACSIADSRVTVNHHYRRSIHGDFCTVLNPEDLVMYRNRELMPT